MKKNEKLKTLQSLVIIWDLTVKKVAACFGKNSAKAEKTKFAGVVCPGMYCYSDGTISSEVLSKKQISGVVGWVDESGRHGLVIGLQEVAEKWSDAAAAFVVSGLTEDGKENTRLILDAAQQQDRKAEAAEWCATYAYDGVLSGEAFLPSRDELIKIAENLDAVQAALGRINRPLLRKRSWYWSSSLSRTSVPLAWRVDLSGKSNASFKDCFCYVRCVFAF